MRILGRLLLKTALLVLCLSCAASASASDYAASGRKMIAASAVAPADARTILSQRSIPVLYAPAGGTPPEIAALARGLRNKPDLIYAYVHDGIRFDPSYGVQKGLLGTFLSGSGNAFDQAALMVALLRASGYGARYVHGAIRLNAAQIHDWVGLPDNVDLIKAYFASAGIPVQTSPESGSVPLTHADIDHVWVMTWIGNAYYAFDPGFKTHTETVGVDLAAAMNYDRSTFLTQAGGTFQNVSDQETQGYSHVQSLNRENVRAALTTYAANLKAYVGANLPDKSIDALLGARKVAPAPAQVRQTELPYQLSVDTWTGDIPDAYHTFFGLAHGGIEVVFRSADIYAHRLTLFHDAGQAALYLDGVSVATGASGDLVEFEVDHPYAAADDSQTPETYGDQSGSVDGMADGSHAILTGFGQAGRGLIEYHSRKLQDASNAGDLEFSEPYLGRTMALMGFNYLAELAQSDDLAAKIAKCRVIAHHQIGMITHDSALAGGPFRIEMAAGRSSIAGLTENPGDLEAAFLERADRGSILESGVIGQSRDFSGISAAKYLDLANNDGRDVIRITAANWNYVSTNLDLAACCPQLVAKIESLIYAAAPYQVLIPVTDSLTVGDWRGLGAIAVAQKPDGSSDWSNVIHLVDDEESAQQLMSLATTLEQSVTLLEEDPPAPPIENWSGTYIEGTTTLTFKIREIVPTVGIAAQNAYDRYAAILTCSGFQLSGTYGGVTHYSHEAITGGLSQYYDIRVSQVGTYSEPTLHWLTDCAGISSPSIVPHWYLDVWLAPKDGYSLPPITTYEQAREAAAIKSAARNSILSNKADNACPINYTEHPIDLIDGSYFHVFDDLSVGNRAPEELAFRRSYYSKSSRSDSGLGWGWGHDFQSSVTRRSDALTALGENLPVPAAAAVAALYAANDVLQNSRGIERLVLVSMIHAWLMEQSTDNAVTLSFPGGSKTFYKLADGTYTTGGCCGPDTLAIDGEGNYLLTGKHGDQHQFDAQGRLVLETDTNGNTVSYQYNEDGTLATVSNSFGRSMTFTYTDGRLSQASAGSGSVQFAYNAAGQMISSTDPGGQVATYEYDAQNRMTRIYKPSNPNVPYVLNTYDDLDHVATQSVSGKAAFSYHFSPLRSETMEPGIGSPRVLTFDVGWFENRFRKPLQSIDPYGYITASEYDGLGRLTRRTLPIGNASSFTYDEHDNLLTQTVHATSAVPDLVTTYAYEPLFNKLSAVTDPLGRVWTMSYDPGAGNLLTITHPQVSAQTPVTVFTYTSQGFVQTAVDPSGLATAYGYDAAGDLTGVTVDSGGLNLTTTLTYDADGNVTGVTDPAGHTTTAGYDARRLMTQSVAPNPFAYITNYEYDADGAPNLVQRVGPPVQTETASWTLTGKPATAAGPLGYETLYQYDDWDRPTAVVDPEGRATRFQYTGNGWWGWILDTDNVIERRMSRNWNEQIYRDWDGNGNSTGYLFDGYGRRYRANYLDGTYERLYLDDAGRTTSVRTRDAQYITYVLDDLDRTTSRTVPGHGTDTYTYDLAGRLLTADGPGGTVTYAYDTAGRLTGETQAGRAVGYQYDANSNLTRITYPDGAYVVYAYDELDRLTGVSYDPNDELTAPGPSTVAAYTYDSLSRRTRIDYANGASTAYTYDLNDNPTRIEHQWNQDGAALDYGYDQADLVNSLTVDDYRFQPWFGPEGDTVNTPNNLNQYTRAGTQTLTYTTAGNLSGDGTRSFTYDSLNRLRAFGTIDPIAAYGYDALGRRASKIVSGATTTFLYAGDRIIAEYSSAGQLTKRYIYGPGIDEPLAMIDVDDQGEETFYYYHADRLGSIIALTDANGDLAESYHYTAYGQPFKPSAFGNPFLYTGREYDSESGLYHYRARAYDPILRRFLQPDPIGFESGMNLYAYVLNDPVNAVDPWGLFAEGSSVFPYTAANGRTAHDLFFMFIDEYFKNPDNIKHDRALRRLGLGISLNRPDLIHLDWRMVFELKPVTHCDNPKYTSRDLAQLNGYSSESGFDIGFSNMIVKGRTNIGWIYDYRWDEYEMTIFPNEPGDRHDKTRGFIYYELYPTGKNRVVDPARKILKELSKGPIFYPKLPPSRQPER